MGHALTDWCYSWLVFYPSSFTRKKIATFFVADDAFRTRALRVAIVMGIIVVVRSCVLCAVSLG